MKKLFALSLSAVMALSFVGCQNSTTADSDTSVNSIESTVPVTESQIKNDIYNLYDYENDEVFYVEKMDLNDKLSALCTTYEFSFLSDGYQIKAYISIPNESIETQKSCKCLLYNRGGHYSYGSLDYEYLSTICAYTKRIVVACEIRGDNGSEGQDQFGGDELHDVIKLIDLCENHFGFVDMDDFGTMGVSRGGVATYMTARQDKRIKKIIVCSGIADLFQCYEEREDGMKQVLRDCIGGSPEEMPEEYEKRSAVCWADEINIPVLIVHSKGDERVPFEQAQKMYDLLKDHTDCTFISHDDDLHGIHEDDIPKVIEWLENK